MTVYPCILLVTLLLAYANGANDNFKGVATLFGSGTTRYGMALAWGTFCTLAGSAVAFLFAGELVKTFSGAGLVPDEVAGASTFATAVGLSAALTVILATLLSFPISTTHALIGALTGAGLVLAQGDVRFSMLGAKFFLPLLISPLAAAALTLVLYPLCRSLRVRMGVRRETCICVGERWVPVAVLASGRTQAASGVPTLTVCQDRYQGTLFSIDAQSALDTGHVVSAGAVSFARGLNDTPKIVALLLAARALDVGSSTVVVGLAIALGALLQARRVAETMAKKITEMNHGQGITANLVTAALTALASRYGLPVSTTHVSCGSLFGLGTATHRLRRKAVVSIALAWIVTLPAAGVMSAIMAAILK
ncbi:MAG: inorganic phosphate transporter [Planctomycetes bacterium]|nr:inorganic phosphate transporter [Planctomycetota bacterium]